MDHTTQSLDEFLRGRVDAGSPPAILALGEPMHGEEAFLWLRNELFAHLVEHWGYRSIALESSYPRGTLVDAYVRDAAGGDLDDTMASGFSHGWGESKANRALVDYLARTNAERDPADRVAFFGFDTPTEMIRTDSPTETLARLYGFLRNQLGQEALPHRWETIAERLGQESRWTDTAAVMDPARSPGNSTDVRELRLITDDLLLLLKTERPRLLAGSSRRDLVTAELLGRNAAMLLRYHATLADPSPSRLTRGLALRDAQMAENLATLAELEVPRGPMLVFAHNMHLLTTEAHWRLNEQDLRWYPAGALLRARLGSRYAVLATALGSAPGHKIGEPPPNSPEGRLAGIVPDRSLLPVERLRSALLDVPNHETGLVVREGVPRVSYFPLEPRQLDGLDAVLAVHHLEPTEPADTADSADPADPE